MWSRNFEGPPTPNDMVDVVDSAVADGRGETAYPLAAAMLDYNRLSPFSAGERWTYGWDYWLGVTSVLGMQRVVRARKRTMRTMSRRRGLARTKESK